MLASPGLIVPGIPHLAGAGEVIPFLNLFIQRKFGLDLTSLNAVFAFTSLGTVAAILAQPALAQRYGQITSVVIVQAASIPFLAVLGFSPLLWMVILAMAVRSSLMNAGNPIFSAFAMEHVSPVERATLAAATTVLCRSGWVVGGIYYTILQAFLGFDGGYTVDFVTIIALYTIADRADLGLVRAWGTPAGTGLEQRPGGKKRDGLRIGSSRAFSMRRLGLRQQIVLAGAPRLLAQGRQALMTEQQHDEEWVPKPVAAWIRLW